MARGSKYPQELRERAVRMVIDHRDDYESEWAAMRAIAEMLGIATSETLRKWVRQEEVDDGARPGVSTAEQQRIRDLEREVRELRRANEILRKASAYFAQAELDRPRR